MSLHMPDEFAPSRQVYNRDHIRLAAVGAIGAFGLLLLIDNDYAWTGLVAAPAAVALRGVYVASEEMGKVWRLSGNELIGPQGRRVFLHQIAKVRRLGSAVQIVTEEGDKHLIKYLADPKAAQTRIETAIKARRE